MNLFIEFNLVGFKMTEKRENHEKVKYLSLSPIP